MVREGAVYGMEGHRGSTDVAARLREMVSDESPGVRAAAAETLQGLDVVAESAGAAARSREDELRSELADVRRVIDPSGVRNDAAAAWLVEHVVGGLRERVSQLEAVSQENDKLRSLLESLRGDIRGLLELHGVKVGP